ncbi:MAG TPA: hypothetical protein VH621_06850, partial [Nitrososphaera sp.]
LNAVGDNTDEAVSSVVEATEIAHKSGNRDLLMRALLHRFADVRVAALTGLSDMDGGLLSPEVLALTADKSSTVKKHLIKLLEQYGSEKYLDSLVALAADEWNSSSHHEEEPNFPIAQAAAKLLLEGPHTVDADLRKRLGVIVQKSADSDVKLLLLRVMVRRGTPDTKKKVTQIATGRAAGSLPRLTSKALVSEAEHVDAASLAEISDDILRTRSAMVSCLLTLLLALKASEERTLSAAQSLSADPDRKALLIMLLLGVPDHQEELGNKILALIPEAARDTVVIALSGGEKMTQNILDTLGDVRIITAMKPWIKDFIQ